MLRNYLKIAVRNLWRNKVYSLINILGLAIGVAACFLIFLIVSFELSYDTFHQNYSRIYRVVTEEKYPEGSIARNPGAPVPVTEALRLDIPQLEKVAAFNASYGSQITVLGKDKSAGNQAKKFIEPIGVFFMETQFFEIFDNTWLAGNPKTALKAPNTIVLSKSQADKYFGTWTNAVGQFLKMDNALTLEVTGVIKDIPDNSDFPLRVMVSFETYKKNPDLYNYNTDWGSTSSNHQVYVLLSKKISLANAQKSLEKFGKKHYKEKMNAVKYNLLQPLRSIHFDTRFGSLGDHQTGKATLWTLSLIGVLVLLMACINFINLATAQAVGRSREVGVRKVLGSNRLQLLGQFMGESTLVVLLASMLGMVIAEIALPFIRQISNVPENIQLFENPLMIVVLLLIILIVSILSGLYPALFLSGFEPVQALKNKISVRNRGNLGLRRFLVILQFGISQVLIISTIVAVRQMDFIRRIDLGFSKEAVYMTSLSSDSISQAKFQSYKNEILQIPGVKSLSLASDPPSSDNNWGTNFSYNKGKDADFNTFLKFGDADYFKTYGLQIIAGRVYYPSDTIKEYVVNETLLKKLRVKNPQDAIGKLLKLGGGEKAQWKPIVGVVKDFKANSVREDMKAMVISPRKQFYFRSGIKIQPANLKNTVAQIQQVWEKYFPDYVFEGYFLDERIAEFYRQENQLAMVYKIFAGLAIFISCLGLYGLVLFLAVQKTKEIGIRKVLGASIFSILKLMSRDFVMLVLVAFLIASPVAWYLMNLWLQNFVYRTEISILTFVFSGLLALLITLLTVSFQAYKTARANPVEVLRNE